MTETKHITITTYRLGRMKKEGINVPYLYPTIINP